MGYEIFHSGIGHDPDGTPHSGRHPWDPSLHQNPDGSIPEWYTFMEKREILKSQGITSNKELAKAFGLSTNDYTRKVTLCNAEFKASRNNAVLRMAKHGDSISLISKKTGIPMQTVSDIVHERSVSRKAKIDGAIDLLEKRLKDGNILDVGLGSNYDMNLNKPTFDAAVKALRDKGYEYLKIEIPQPNDPNHNTTIAVLAPSGTTKKELWEKRGEIQTIKDYTPDGGKTFIANQPPSSLDSSRVYIQYTDENGKGGAERDGMIGIRPGVKDLSLGNSLYAQIRMMVDDKYYIKGMAVYDDRVPDGYDVIVYSNKKAEQGIEKALKPVKTVELTGEIDRENPFGATIKAGGQSYYDDKDGDYIRQGSNIIHDPDKKMEGERCSLSPLNKIKEEGEWGKGVNHLASQFLAKQRVELIEKQLNLSTKDAYAQYDDIMSVGNNAVRKKMLMDFAESCDRAAIDLDAAALPRQTTKVILPIPSLRDNEIYAPGYKNGETVVMVRFPHTGPYEIPYLTVNNRNPEAKKLIQNGVDAVGIGPVAAHRLSGADFDGDFALVIPVDDKTRIAHRVMKSLEDFDPSEAYPGYPGMKVIGSDEKGRQMGVVSNLIMDMYLQGAPDKHLEKAVKHALVVIDAEKHELNHELSYKENDIEELRKLYQKNPNNKKGYGGAATLLTRAKSPVTIPAREVTDASGEHRKYTPDPETGEWHYRETGEYKMLPKRNSKKQIVLDDDGKPIYEKVYKKIEVPRMSITKDARDLISTDGTKTEYLYADYANKMKALANKSRKEAMAIPTIRVDKTAASTYVDEVESLNAQYERAVRNKPLERQAQAKTSVRIADLRNTNPELFDKSKKDKLRKERSKILANTRVEVGASGKNTRIHITEKEWKAIQANAISNQKLDQILQLCDMKEVRKMAIPKESKTLSQSKIDAIRSRARAGFPIEEIAESMDVSTSTVTKYLKEAQ